MASLTSGYRDGTSESAKQHARIAAATAEFYAQLRAKEQPRECDLCGSPMGDEAGTVHQKCADDEAARDCAVIRDLERGGCGE